MGFTRMHRPAVLFASILLASVLQPSARADEFPSKPIRIISQAPAGSPPDAIGRIVADRLGQLWNQQVLFVNRPGAGGVLAAQAAVAAEPDGYTLYQATSASLLVLPVTQPTGFDLNRDMTPIGLMAEQPFFIAVTPSLGAATLSDLIALAKQRPGTILYGGARGGGPHLATEFLRAKAGIDMTFVPHPNVPQALQDVVAGRIHLMVEGLAALSGPIHAGAIKALAVMSPDRLSALPDVPAVAEVIPGFSVTSWFALMAPAKTPAPVVQKVNDDLRTAFSDAALQAKLQALGASGRPMTPKETAGFIRDQQANWWPIVKQVLATP